MTILLSERYGDGVDCAEARPVVERFVACGVLRHTVVKPVAQTARTLAHSAVRQGMRTIIKWLTMTGACIAALPAAAEATGPAPARPTPAAIHVIHEPPTDPSHRAVYKLVQGDATFARARDVFTLFNLPKPITIRTRSCSGRGGAWYYEGTVTICYGYVQTILDNARSPERPSWVSEDAAIAGPMADVVLHEGAHALFEFLKTPLLGREEDAADMFATFVLLNVFRADAKALISGIAYSYLNDARVRNFTELPAIENRVLPSRAYGGAHSTPLQRLYSVICHASGFDEAVFRDLKRSSDLPVWRAGGCEDEYNQIAHAFRTLLGPHIDADRAKAMFPYANLTAAPTP